MSQRPKSRSELLMWVAAGLCLVFALLAPLFGDSPTAVTVPLVCAVVIAGGAIFTRQSGSRNSD